MRNAMVLSLLAGLAGCGGFGPILADNTEFPGSLPNTPRAEGENMRRVSGQAPQVLPIMPQARNIWPVLPDGQVDPAQGDRVAAMLPGAGARPGGGAGHDLPAGGEMQIGNDAVDDGLPGHVSALSSGQGATHKGAADAAIIVPNGDGTTTEVSADGTVHEQQAP
ncbi:hypothetical protein RI056_13705 [Komagataeibacter nataicola]|nr:hypothetical protein RI056_13705 [Komagataeibacter nataicola]